MVRILNILVIIAISCFAELKVDTNLKIMAKYDGQNILIKWVPPKLANNYEYKIYRASQNKPMQLIQKQRKKTYEYVKNNISKKLAFMIYPYKNVKSFNEKYKMAYLLDNVQGARKGIILRDNKLANALGVYFVDKSVRMKQKYRYTIEVYENGKKVAYNSFDIKTFKAMKPKAITDLKIINEENFVALKWNITSPFDIYNVYRKDPKSSQYIKINKAMISVNKSMKYYFKDKNLKPNRMYKYAVSVVDPFGQESEYSFEMVGYLKSKKEKNPISNIKSVINNKYIKLMWDEVKQKDISYNIYRSVEITAGYKRLNKKPLKKPVYIDKDFSLNKNYFYYVTIVKNKKESEPSVKKPVSIKDTTAPSTPKNFKVDVKAGEFILNWDKVDAKDLLGYRVYRTMDDTNRHWEMITKKELVDNHFIHKVPKTLSRNFYFYKISAVDKDFNESKFSKSIKVKLPDVTAPKQPVITEYKVYENILSLKWNNIIVYDMDHFNLYTQVGKKLVKLNDKPLYLSSFKYNLPKNIQGERKYLVTAVDKAGNESSKDNYIIVNHLDLIAPKIEDIQYKIEKNNLKISFNVKDDDYNGFEIFRSSGKNTKYYNISTFKRGMQYIDTKLDPKRTYYYQIRVYDKAGNVRVSDTKEIKIKG
jgi:hypothetical protein